MKAAGLRCSRREAETEDRFRQRICQEGTSSIGKVSYLLRPQRCKSSDHYLQRIYHWLCSRSPNKVKRATLANIPDPPSSSYPSRRYTPYQVFKASPTAIASSQDHDIGEWNKRLRAAFNLQSPEKLQELQRRADLLNKESHQVSPELAELARQE